VIDPAWPAALRLPCRVVSGLPLILQLALALGFSALQESPPATSREYFELRAGLEHSRRVFEQTGAGRVAFLGGSITQNPGWRDLVCDDLRERFPDTRFDFIAAGIASSGSTPGAFRLERDVFARGRVDLLFEEAAVNDSSNGRSDTEQVRGMEGIVRHARRLNPEIDVVLMHFVDPAKMEDYRAARVPSVIANHERVAEHYALPSINLALEVTERIARGEFSWEEDFKNLHPAPFGQELYFRSIRRMLDAAWAAESTAAAERRLPPRLDSFCYSAGTLLPPTRAGGLAGFRQDECWDDTLDIGTRSGFFRVPMLVGEEPGARFEFTFRGSAVGLFVASGPDAGIVEYRVDGGSWERRDLYTRWSARLHLPWLQVLEAELDAGVVHRLEVRIAATRNDKSHGHACRVVHFAVNRDEP